VPSVVLPDPDDKEIAHLVKQLGSDIFKEREAATKRLEEIGEPALGALAKAHSTLEVRRRAEAIITAIDNKMYGKELLLIGHDDIVWTVSLSADGKRVLTSSTDATLRLWDADTGQCLRVFEGHTSMVRGAALSPDGKRVLSGSCDKTVRLWDAATGKEIHQMTGHTATVFNVAFGPEGKAISGGQDGTMRLWDLNTGKQIEVFGGHTGPVISVAYHAKAKLAATSSMDPSTRLWDLESGKQVRQLYGHSGDGFMTVAISGNAKFLAVATGSERLHIFELAKPQPKEPREMKGSRCAAFSPDGKRLATANQHNTVYVRDVVTGEELRKYEGHHGIVTCVAYFPDGKRIASGSFDGTVRIWRAPR
jgi:WD40 repeat protein